VQAVKSPNNSVVYFEGYLQVPADGAYTFYVNGDAGSLLRIHETTVIDADYSFASGKEMQGKILLKAGLHPFRFYPKKNNGQTITGFSMGGTKHYQTNNSSQFFSPWYRSARK